MHRTRRQQCATPAPSPALPMSSVSASSNASTIDEIVSEPMSTPWLDAASCDHVEDDGEFDAMGMIRTPLDVMGQGLGGAWDVSTHNVLQGAWGMADVAKNGAGALTERGLGLMSGKVLVGAQDGFEVLGQTARGGPGAGALAKGGKALAPLGLAAGAKGFYDMHEKHARGELTAEDAILSTGENAGSVIAGGLGTWGAMFGLGALGTTTAAVSGSFAGGLTLGRTLDTMGGDDAYRPSTFWGDAALDLMGKDNVFSVVNALDL